MNESINGARKAHDLYWENYLSGQWDVLASLLDGNYLQIGSVEEEVFFNKKDAVGFVKTLDLAYTRFEDVKKAEQQARLIREERVDSKLP